MVTLRTIEVHIHVFGPQGDGSKISGHFNKVLTSESNRIIPKLVVTVLSK